LGNYIKTYLKEIEFQVNGKGEVRPRTGHEGQEGEFRYSSTLSARRYMGIGSQHHASATLPPERPGIYCTGSWMGSSAGLEW
jgi:hypothetical protein